MTDQAKKKALNKHFSEVLCPGCGQAIRESDDMSRIQYVRTKRATDVFFFILNVLGKHGTGEKRMGKVDDYTAGRSQGLILAREIVKKDGIEGLEKEIQFRNITGVNTALTRKELNIACEKIKNMTLDTMMVIAVATLHDEFGFAGKRCKRFIDRMNLKAECLVDDMATWDEYTKMIKDEIGIEMAIRRND